MPSNALRTQRQVVEDLAHTAGVPHVLVTSLPGGMVKHLGLFSPVIWEFAETSYPRDRPFVVDDSAARVTFDLKPTPWAHILSGINEEYRHGD